MAKTWHKSPCFQDTADRFSGGKHTFAYIKDISLARVVFHFTSTTIADTTDKTKNWALTENVKFIDVNTI